MATEEERIGALEAENAELRDAAARLHRLVIQREREVAALQEAMASLGLPASRGEASPSRYSAATVEVKNRLRQ
jgi:hypothetical protein